MRDDEHTRLVEAARAGSRGALEALWSLHRGWLSGVIAAHAPRGSDVEDLLQDVALRVVANLRELSDPAAFRAWLRTIAVNRARSALRETRTRGRRSVRPLEDAETVAAADERAGTEQRARVRAVLEAIARLDPRYAEPLLLKSVHGQSQRLIASALGISEEAVESRLARARRLLRAALAHEGEQVGAHDDWRTTT